MSEPGKTLFMPVVAEDQLHESFVTIRDQQASKPTRWMLDRIFQDFDDPDGNFLEQFQTTGFDARFFELYLFAYFSRSGFEIYREHPNPDFLVTLDQFQIAVEATTVNPAQSGAMAESGRSISDLNQEEMIDYLTNELPIRLGSPLYSKLKKRYWELEHCKDLPFVVAIEAFHDPLSLGMSDQPLSTYLYGERHKAGWSNIGRLEVDVENVDEHEFSKKVIPSGFFSLSDAENVSAVIFTNSGTSPKFSRMGYQHGIGCEEIHMIRSGYCYTPDLEVRDASLFSYNMDYPPVIETWGQGLVIFHNPLALRPIPIGFFPDTVDCYVQDGMVVSDHRAWHPFSSTTQISHLGAAKAELKNLCPHDFLVIAISKVEFDSMFGAVRPLSGMMFKEDGWYTNSSRAFLGVIYKDATDGDWGCMVLARNEYFGFEPIATNSSILSREEAVIGVQHKIAELLRSAQRIFP